MKIIGHGIDAVDVNEILAALESTSKLWEKGVYSEQERNQADPPPIATRYFAGRFAGKEAVVKALGSGFAGDVTWAGVEVLRRDNGAPYVRLSGAVQAYAETLGITNWQISITHCGNISLASVIALGD